LTVEALISRARMRDLARLGRRGYRQPAEPAPDSRALPAAGPPPMCPTSATTRRRAQSGQFTPRKA